MKKFIALVLSLIMALSLCAPAWAATEEYTMATQEQTNALAKTLSEATAGDTIRLEALHYGLIHLGSGAYPYDYPADLTIVGQEGTAFTGFSVSNEEISGWTFQNITFIGNPSDNEGNADGIHFSTEATVTGLTIDNCKFVNGANFSMINTSGANFADITIKNNTSFSNTDGTAILLQGVNGFKVADCTFTNVGYNAIQTNKSTGACSITGNTINGCGSRAMRIATRAGAVLTISGNTITNADNANDDTVADRGQVIKISGAVTNGTFENNTHNGATIVFADGVAFVPVAEVDGVEYKTLADAVAAAKGDDTITLLDDVTLETELRLPAGVTLDGAGKTIYAGDVANWADPAVWCSRDHMMHFGANNIIKNVTFDSMNAAYGVQAHADDAANNVQLIDVTIKNSKGVGLTVNGVDVTAENLVASGNAWGDVNVDPGDGVATKSAFAVSGDKTNLASVIYTEGKNVTSAANMVEITISGGNYGGVSVAEGAGSAVVTGGTFVVDPTPYVAEGYKAVEGNGVYTVMKTYNVTFDANGGKGEYTLAPVVEGKLVLPANPFTAPEGKIFKAWSVDGVEYAAGEEITVAAAVTVTALWMNAPVEVEDDVMVQVTDPVMIPNPKLEGEAADIADEVDVSEICTEAMTEVVEDVASEDVSEAVIEEKTAELADKLNTTAEAIEDEIVVVVQTNFEVKVEAVSVEGDKTTVTLDITPVYQKVVTTETIANSGAKIEAGENAVVAEKGELDLKGQNVEITIAIPDVLVTSAASNGNKLYVTHTKDDAAKTSFVYEATVDPVAKTATFFNPNGFSTFTISATNSIVAEEVESGMKYADLKSAITNAGKGAVIEVLVSDQVVNITAPCSFKLKWADNITEPKINVAEGYTMSKWYVNGVYTYIVQSASAGGYAPSTTPEKVVTSADTFDAGIALYVGMSVMAAAGSAVVLKKRED